MVYIYIKYYRYKNVCNDNRQWVLWLSSKGSPIFIQVTIIGYSIKMGNENGGAAAAHKKVDW